MLAEWPLDPAITYLNHGTVGVAPKRVLARQQALRDEIERQPARVMLREVGGFIPGRTEPSRLRVAAAEIAAFIGARSDDVVFVDNATAGVNAVMRSIAPSLEPGDEFLLTDHGYGSNLRTATLVTRERGAVVRTVAVPYPAFDAAELVARIAAACTPRTRLLVIDHITSESGLILPVREVAEACRSLGVPVLVDGAHAPGVLRLDVPSIGADWYVGNLHKWAHAPRSSGVFWAHPSRQDGLHPAVISWGLDAGFQAEFDWLGTRDPTPWLAAPEGLASLRDLGLDAIWRYNHALAWRAATELAAHWRTPRPASEHEIGFMATVGLPDRLGATPADAARVRNHLLFEDAIEVQVHAGYGRLWTRVSAQVYTEWADIERLSDAVDRLARA
jgi:isopenicillin-N epimerase